ncbi:hypothetical protein LCGC14_2747450 [marine sediment metagenome]|uniref:Uncharacterized protein n=1 Tax=marine sediment metagenome TaxID=412755 RepID=A0A0F9BBJ5_9ZZZZ
MTMRRARTGMGMEVVLPEDYRIAWWVRHVAG